MKDYATTAAVSLNPARHDNQPLFEVKSEELVACFRARAENHLKLAREWEKAIEEYTPPKASQWGQQAAMNAYQQGIGYQPPDQRPDMRERAEHHRSEARRFTFRAEHVIPGQVFRLSQRDLYDMGVPE